MPQITQNPRKKPVAIPKADRVDLMQAKHTYGQSVALGRGAADATLTDAQRIKALIKVLHPEVEPAVNRDNFEYALEIMHGVQFWAEQLKKQLEYKPTADEKLAGYERLSDTLGPMGVAVAIGKDFSQHPDEVFRWTFGSVVAVLRRDIVIAAYTKRLHDIRERKRAQAAKGRGGRKR